jgi:flavin-dependent dehydrogenase
VQFFSPDGHAATPFYFSEIENGESAITWQVNRLDFDEMLLDNAASSGVEVHQEANVRDVLFDGERATGVRVQLADGSRTEIGCKVVVDASGQSAMLSRRMKLKEVDAKLRHASLYTRYRGAVRDAGIDEGATLIMHTRDRRSWFWYIPQPDDEVSVGVVGPLDRLLRGEPEQIYAEELAECPALQPRIADAEQLWPVRAIRDFSYISRRIAGDGWVLTGDAFGFLDPIYSTGVFLALKSGEGAADSILDAFRHDDFSAARLGQHGAEYVAGMESLRKLVYAYYDDGFSFPRFLARSPDSRDALVNLLIGNVFRHPVDRLFDAMGEMCELPEARTLEPDGAPR